MKIYLVGGAVRDKLLGLPVIEKDWVVVGANIADMLKLGYKQVGKEFPVFLHPKTGDEYALARMERKVKPGYTGFTFDTSPDVTLEEDLIRRDLTINAMAETAEGELIDPYHGKADLDNKILRHVSPSFAEDPVRILRLGRFNARYFHHGFTIAPETIKLMQEMVQAGEVDALVPERVWKELERALGEKNPEQFFMVLAQCHALPILFPNLDINGIGMTALNAACQITTNKMVRFAALVHALPDAKNAISLLCNRYRLPNAYHELAKLTAVHHSKALLGKKLSGEQLLQLFNGLDIFRREERFQHFLQTCQAIAQANGQTLDTDWLLRAAYAAKSVDVHAIIAKGFQGQALAEQLKEKRAEKIKDFMQH